MSETVETIPKSTRERLDEIEEGGYIPITELERKNFSLEMSRSFHKPELNNPKRFKMKTMPVTNEIRVWRIS